MKRLFDSPHAALFFAVPFVLLTPLVNVLTVRDVALSGTEINQGYMAVILAVVLCAVGAGYWYLKRKGWTFNHTGFRVHVLATLALSIGVMFLLSFGGWKAYGGSAGASLTWMVPTVFACLALLGSVQAGLAVLLLRLKRS